jgi:hypothetical protein
MSLTKVTNSMISGALLNILDYGAIPGADSTAAINAALAAVNTAGGAGATVELPQGGFIVSSTIVVPDRVKLVGAGSRSTIISSNFAGPVFSFPGRTNAGVSGVRIGLHPEAGATAIDITTPGGVDSRWLLFRDLEISTASLLNGQVGISAVTSGAAIITECVFDDIRLYEISSPFNVNGPEGNIFTNITVAGFGAGGPTSAIGPAGNANIWQGRVAGGPFAGSIAYSEIGARNIVDLIVDIGATSTALNVTGAGNIIRLSRPEVLTPVGTFSSSTVVIDSEFIAAKHMVARGATPTSAAFSLGAGFGSGATVTSIVGSDQRIQFVINSAGTGQAAYPSINYTFTGGPFPFAPIPQITRDGGNQSAVSVFASSSSVNGWGCLFGGTPVDGESYQFIVTVG